MRPEPHRERADVWHDYRADRASFGDADARIHVWRVGLDDPAEPDCSVLSDDERARAERFSRPLDRRRFVAARATLRAILADMLELDASARPALRFGYRAAGKPFLVDHPTLHFNVSHSEDLALVAATRAGEIGVDIERQRPMDDMDTIARVAFSDSERAALIGCPSGARSAVFYRIWTRKEALLKALGAGLPALSDPDAASLGGAATRWLVTALPHLDGYVASLARPRTAHGMTLWSWPNAAALRSVERRARPRTAPVALPSPLPRWELCP